MLKRRHRYMQQRGADHLRARLSGDLKKYGYIDLAAVSVALRSDSAGAQVNPELHRPPKKCGQCHMWWQKD